MRRLLPLLLALSLLAGPTRYALADSAYVVQAGDTLSAIAAAYGTTVAAIAAANRIANPNLIYVGQTLVIPGGSGAPIPPSGGTCTSGTYVAVSGDTLYEIALQFGTTVATLASLNEIANINLIYVGQVLELPGGTCPAGSVPPPAAPVPLPPPTSLGSFELGGQVAGFSYPDQMRYAGMTWEAPSALGPQRAAEQPLRPDHGRPQ